MPTRVHIFWDNSNIFIPAKYVANRRDGYMVEHAVRVHFENLYKLAVANREMASGVCVGSVPPELEAVWDRLRSTGIDVELYERGADSGTEQGVDQCLQVHMLRRLADEKERAVAVLLTGDGAGYEDGVGFHADLERLAGAGWGIEVLAWDKACNSRLREWAQRTGVYIPLDDFYESVTFISGTRDCRPLSLTHRALAQPVS